MCHNGAVPCHEYKNTHSCTWIRYHNGAYWDAYILDHPAYDPVLFLIVAAHTRTHATPRARLPPHRNLHKETKFEGGGQDEKKNGASAADPPAPPTAQAATHATVLTPMAMELVMSRFSSAGDTATAATEVQGLTQMYYLDEEAEKAMVAPVSSTKSGEAATAVVSGGVSCGKEALTVVAAASSTVTVMASSQDADGAFDDDLAQQPQGLSQLFYLEAEEEEKAAAALPLVTGRSFLREKLGVPGVVVQDLKQVRKNGRSRRVFYRMMPRSSCFEDGSGGVIASLDSP